MKDGYINEGYFDDPETGLACMYVQADELESSDELPSYDGLCHRILYVQIDENREPDHGGVVKACINRSGEFYDAEWLADEPVAILIP